MITWIQTSLGKHHKPLLGTLLGITIVSFVFFGAWSGAQGQAQKLSYLGVNLNSEREREPYRDLVILNQSLRTNRDDASEESLRFYVLSLHLADRAQIPTLTGEELRKGIESLFGGAENMSKFMPNFLAEAGRHLGTSPAATNARVERFFSNSLRLQKLNEILGGPGYSAPHEAVLQWQLSNTLWQVESATLPFATFNPTITPDAPTLETYFNENKEAFRLAPIITASYALFPATDADSKDVPADTDDATLRAFFHNNANSPDLAGFDAAKLDEQLKTRRPELVKAWRNVRVRENLAGRLSTALAAQLPLDEPASETKIQKLLADYKATEASLPPLSKDNIPTTLPIPATQLNNVFELNNDTWHSNVFVHGNNGLVFFHKKTVPARIPELAEVREKVLAAYAEKEKARLFALHAKDTGAQLAAALAAGKNFDESAKQLGYTTEKYPEFKTLETPLQLLAVESTGAQPGSFFDPLPAAVRYLSRIPEGSITPLLRSSSDALYLRLVKKTNPALDPKSKEIQDLSVRLASMSSGLSLGGYQTQQVKFRGLFDDLAPAPAKQ